jgi:hypothetical protein
MRGENICYGKKEIILEVAPTTPDETLNSAQET